MHQLYSGSSPLRLARPAPNELEIEIADGFGATPMDGIFGDGSDLSVGSQRALPAFRTRVLATTDDGRPRRVHFSFPSSLESRERLFLSWEGNQPVAFALPAIGASRELMPLSIDGAFAP